MSVFRAQEEVVIVVSRKHRERESIATRGKITTAFSF